MKLPIAEIIRRLRRERNITQEELAGVIGVTFQSVSRWENGLAYPDMELIPLIARYFDISTDVLFGTDRETREINLEKHYSNINSVKDNPHSFYIACKDAYNEFPDEFSFGLWLSRCYIDMDIRPYKEHIEEIRDICKNILDNCSIEDYRIEAMHKIIITEDEDKLDVWLDKVPCWKSCREILLETRYKYNNDIEKYSIQQQENILSFFGYTFYNCINENNSKEAIDGYTLILKIIDIMRDTNEEIDAWLTKRADILLRISGLYFIEGYKDKGYEALEHSIDSYTKYAELPIEAKLSYNCVLFNKLYEDKKCADEDDTNDKGEYACYWAYQALIKDNGCFSSVHGDEKFKSFVDKLGRYIAVDKN